MDVIKLRTLRRGDYPELSVWVYYNHKNHYKSEAGGFWSHRRSCNNGSRGQSNVDTNQGMQAVLRSQTKLEVNTLTENSENL